MATPDEVPDPANLDFWLTVNGQPRQRANTRDLVLGIPELIELASSFYTLHPGDLLFTGTPEGVGPVEAVTSPPPMPRPSDEQPASDVAANATPANAAILSA
ncbi:MAG: hypothetical protein ABT00_15425 [Bordetella sp. SCN 68-11]|nr:MAG: hypothetical protein ABT00_15425 [Bordetella sp. SCN 68-11]